MKNFKFIVLIYLFVILTLTIRAQTDGFNYKKYITGQISSLSVNITSIDRNTGIVAVNGVDTKPCSRPFTWMWGDGSSNEGWFPQSHTYSDKSKNYIVKTISHYTDNTSDTSQCLVTFMAYTVNQIGLDSKIKVCIPNQTMTLGTHLYSPPTTIDFFSDNFFNQISRNDLEYLLTVGASIQNEFTNNDLFLFNGKFEEYMFRNASFGGAYSLWFTNPVSFFVGDVLMTGDIDFQSLFHEMGHNFSLNTPATFYFGGKIDGNANAIYSESLAGIYSYATGYELLNNYATYGIGADLRFKIQEKYINSAKNLHGNYSNYLVNKLFCSWNDSSTSNDETFLTFITIAYKFIEHAENKNEGFKVPMKNMMKFLQFFNSNYQTLWDQNNNSSAGNEFRATYMVAALSSAFQEDLQQEFINLNFPVNKTLFAQLISAASVTLIKLPTLTTSVVSEITSNSAICGGDISNDGNAAIISKGICWNTNQNPTITDNKTTEGIGIGQFTSNLTGLQANTKYYVRAYATNSVGTAYGDEVSFTTLTTGIEPVTDKDLFVYPNPTNKILFINGLSGKLKITIYDINGKLMHYKQVINNQIDISKFKHGVYTIKIETSKGYLTQKFVKQ